MTGILRHGSKRKELARAAAVQRRDMDDYERHWIEACLSMPMTAGTIKIAKPMRYWFK